MIAIRFKNIKTLLDKDKNDVLPLTKFGHFAWDPKIFNYFYKYNEKRIQI